MREIVLIGAGGHAKSVIDSIGRAGDYHIAGYTNPQACPDMCDYTYLGTDEALPQLFADGIRQAAIAIGYLGKGNTRNILYEKLKTMGYRLPAIIDPSAVVSEKAFIGEGAFVGKKAVINRSARIGKMAIVNTGAIVEHECRVGEFSHIAVGAVLCGGVSIGNQSLIGSGSTVIQGVATGSEVIVGAGSLVLGNVGDGQTVYGTVKRGCL